MSVSSSWFIVLFKSSVYKMTYCLVVLSIIESGIVKTQLFLLNCLFYSLILSVFALKFRGSIVRCIHL